MKLYHQLAGWWHLLSSPEEYEEEAGLYWEVITRYKNDVKAALELGSGGGNNAFHLKKKCAFTLCDISPDMIHVSQALNPECEHVVGDMRSVDLGRKFDLVFIHDAITLMTTREDLTRVFATAKRHLKPNGLLFMAPDFFTETFRPQTSHGGHDDGQRGIRYLEWTYDNDPSDEQVETHYSYVIRTAGGEVKHEHDHSVEGLFSKGVWEELLKSAGFTVAFEPLYHSELEEGSYIGIVGQLK